VTLAPRRCEEVCVCDVAWITADAENLVGHDLRSPRVAGLASSRREGTQRPRSASPDSH